MGFLDDVSKALGWKEIAKVVLPVQKKILKTVVSPQVMDVTKTVAGQVLDMVPTVTPASTASSIPAPASPAPATLPLQTLDVPTASYLEMVEDQAIKQQKALASQVKSAGFVSQHQAQELAMAGGEKSPDVNWLIIVGILIVFVFGRKL